MIKLLAQQTEAGHALVIAGLAEDELQKLLLSAMRALSNNMAERILTATDPSVRSRLKSTLHLLSI